VLMRSDAYIHELFTRLQTLPDGSERSELRSRLVEHFQGLANRIARGFHDRGESADDLRQVAAVGLVNAVDRYNPQRGTKFVTFAMQTIAGEIKRHFRDRSWGVRVPRRLQELNLAVRRANEALTQEFGRPPRIADIAARVGVSEEAALEALELGQQAKELVSLDELADQDEDERGSWGERVLPSDDGVDMDAMDVRAALARLEPRLRRILIWKFVGGYSQSEIARRLGVSQMHVSRLQARAMDQLRGRMGHEPGEETDA